MEFLRPLTGNHRQNSCTRPPAGLHRIGVGAVPADRGAARHRGRRWSPWRGRASSRPRSAMEKERGAHAAPEQGHARSKAAPVPAGTREGGAVGAGFVGDAAGPRDCRAGTEGCPPPEPGKERGREAPPEPATAEAGREAPAGPRERVARVGASEERVGRKHNRREKRFAFLISDTWVIFGLKSRGRCAFRFVL